MKTLNLVEFLIKNGPPSAISSFKYDIYQFRSFSDFQARQEGIDRGQAIREKSKQIVELLSNDQHLQQQRQKAKKIRERMSNVTGGYNYGGHNSSSSNGYGGGDGRYESYNNKSYTNKSTDNSYGSTNYGGLGVYGDYSNNKSTLDKYKTDKNDSKPSINKPLIVPDITGSGSVTQNSQQAKKPFSQIAKKLQKPSAKTQNQGVKPQPSSPSKNKQNTTKQNEQADLFDLVGDSTPTQTVTPSVNNNTVNQQKAPQTLINNQNTMPNLVQQQPNLIQQQPNLVQQQPNLVQQQPALNFNLGYNQPNQGLNYGQQPYGQVYNQQPFGQQQYPQQQQFGMYGQNQQQFFQPVNNNPYSNPYAQQQQQFNQNQGYSMTNTNPYQNFQPVAPLTLSSPVVPQTNNSNSSMITLTTKTKSQQQEFDKFMTAPSQATANVKWLSNDEKGLIDFSDFNSQIKSNNNMNSMNSNLNNTSNKNQHKGNNITIDMWNW